jgi:uncharacterized delta-60 repeat protein
MRVCFLLEPLEPRITLSAGFIASDGIPGGAITLNLGAHIPYASMALFGPNGKVLVSDFQFADENDEDDWCDRAFFMQFNRDGTRDSSFANGGVVDVPCFPEEIDQLLRQPDGKILAKTASSGIFRFNPDGLLDSSFSNDQELFDNVNLDGIALAPHGRIIVTGNTWSTDGPVKHDLYALRADGTVDSSFQAPSIVASDTSASLNWGYNIAVEKDGKMLVNVEDWAERIPDKLLRLNPDGSPDESFADNGQLNFSADDEAGSILLQPDGKIVQVLSTPTDLKLLRVNADGTLDHSFGHDGRANLGLHEYHWWRQAFLQTDGKIIAMSRDHFIARFNSDGSVDTTFGFGGAVRFATAAGHSNFWLNDATLAPNGHLLLFITRDNCFFNALPCAPDTNHILDIATAATSPSLMSSVDGNFAIFAPDAAHQTPPPPFIAQLPPSPTSPEIQRDPLAQKDQPWDENENLIDWENAKPTVLD